MNVLMYLHRYPSYGGIESVTTYISNYLSEKGIKISIFSFVSQNEEKLKSLLNHNIKIYHPLKNDNNEITIKNYLSSILINEKIDIVIFQDSYAPIEQILLNVLSGTNIKLCTVEHNVPNCFIKSLKQEYSTKLKWYPTKQWLSYLYWLFKIKTTIRKRHKLLFKRSDKYILLSTKFYPILKNITGKTDKQKLLSINNPITISIPVNKCFKKEKICLFCGRLTEQKGIKYLMEIWSKIEPNNPEWKLVIVGDGPLKEFVLSAITNYNLKHVILEGFQNDPSIFYSKASILCMCSIFEGWMLSLVEAMVYGCVPITFNSYESASDIITSGINGLLIKPFNINEYVSKLQLLINDSGKRQNMSINAIQNAQRFSIDRIGNEWMTLLESLNIK